MEEDLESQVFRKVSLPLHPQLLKNSEQINQKGIQQGSTSLPLSQQNTCPSCLKLSVLISRPLTGHYNNKPNNPFTAHSNARIRHLHQPSLDHNGKKTFPCALTSSHTSTFCWWSESSGFCSQLISVNFPHCTIGRLECTMLGQGGAERRGQTFPCLQQLYWRHQCQELFKRTLHMNSSKTNHCITQQTYYNERLIVLLLQGPQKYPKKDSLKSKARFVIQICRHFN